MSMQTYERAIIVGGFSTNKRALEPVAQTVFEAEIALDVETIPLNAAMNRPQYLEKAAKGQLLISHSAGILAVANARGISPDQTIAFNGPEPKTRRHLVGASVVKTGQCLRNSITGPLQREHARVVRNNAIELVGHPYANLRHLGAISVFSTLNYLSEMQQAGQEVRTVVTDSDVFFPYDPLHNSAPKVPLDLYSGSHDELLVNPQKFIASLSGYSAAVSKIE